jgi:hypothetical protein
MWRVRKLGKANRIGVGSRDVGSLTGKLRELVNAAIWRCVNILCVHETKWTGQKARKDKNTNFKLWYSGLVGSRRCRSPSR